MVLLNIKEYNSNLHEFLPRSMRLQRNFMLAMGQIDTHIRLHSHTHTPCTPQITPAICWKCLRDSFGTRADIQTPD